MMTAHLADEIRTLGIDITKVQTEGFEHGHQDIKRTSTNKAKPTKVRFILNVHHHLFFEFFSIF
jgi:hypothetical protein